MTSPTLRAITLKTVANYTRAAEHAVCAYRSSGQRLINAMERGVDKAARQGAERLAPRLATALRRATGRVTGLASKSLDAVSTRTERAIELGSTGVTTQLKRVAGLVEGVGNRVVAGGVQAAVRINMPGAQAALALSERVVAGVDKLPGARSHVKPIASAKRAAPARSRAAAGVRKARKAVAEAMVEAAAAVAPKTGRKVAAKPAGVAAAPRRRRSAQAKPVVEAVASAVEAATA